MHPELLPHDTHRYTLSSWHQFAQTFLATPSELTQRCLDRQHACARPSWFDLQSLQQGLDYLQHGWNFGIELQSKVLSQVRQHAHMITRHAVNYDYSGDAVDIARFCEGEPEHFATYRPYLDKAPGHETAWIVMNNCVSSAIITDVLVARGVSALTLAILLEHYGVPTRITLAYAGHNAHGGREGRSEIVITLKDYAQPIEPYTFAFALVHPAAFRLFGHTFQATYERDKEDTSSRLGCWVPGNMYLTPEESQQVIELDNAMFGRIQWTNPIAAKIWIDAQLRRYVVLEGETNVK